MGQAEPVPGDRATDRTFRGFISYSHKDRTFAHWLHRRLERYAFPRGLGHAAALKPLFIDRAELVAGSSLTDQVRAALADSAALIVVASPAARASPWVDQEVALFKALHPDRAVLVALMDGEPPDSFPQAVLTGPDGTPAEPIAADFRPHADGRRLGLLKLVGGLSSVPLDALVRRDARRRQNRVMAVTVLALAIALVTTVLAVVAIRSRDEAQLRHMQSEALVEFMLTDLRQKLKGVGRLDVMDTVNIRAMAYYADQKDLGQLPADSLERRARLLHAMGEDHMDAGKTDQAGREFAEAHRTTAALLAREPDNQDRIFAHAQSEYWLGARWFIKRKAERTGPHWQAYRALAQRLVARDGKSVRNRRELGSAEANLCALALEKPVKAEAAKRHCDAASAEMEAVAKAMPKDIQAQLDYASQIAWSADAAEAGGYTNEALHRRETQLSFVDSLESKFPSDVRVVEGKMLARIGFLKHLKGNVNNKYYKLILGDILHLSRKLRFLDKKNTNWKKWNKEIEILIK